MKVYAWQRHTLCTLAFLAPTVFLALTTPIWTWEMLVAGGAAGLVWRVWVAMILTPDEL